MTQYPIKYTAQFKKDIKIAQKRGYDLEKLRFIIEQLSRGKVLAAKYRNHRLSGNWKNAYECHIEADWLLVYFLDNSEIVLVLARTGTHSDIF